MSHDLVPAALRPECSHSRPATCRERQGPRPFGNSPGPPHTVPIRPERSGKTARIPRSLCTRSSRGRRVGRAWGDRGGLPGGAAVEGRATGGRWGQGIGQAPRGQGQTLGRFARTCAAFPRSPPPPGRIPMDRRPRLPLPPVSRGLGVESKRRWAESQWIVAARPLCHLQYPVAYLSRLQRILPAAREELRFKAARAAHPARGPSQRHVPLGAMPLPRVGDRAARARIASSPDSDLEAFSHNPAHGSFAPLAFQPSAMTNCANQRFLSY